MGNHMDEMIKRLMAHRYWRLLRLQPGGNALMQTLVFVSPGMRELVLHLVMMGFYPMSVSVRLAFGRIEELAPNDEVRRAARMFRGVEEGKSSVAAWDKDV